MDRLAALRSPRGAGDRRAAQERRSRSARSTAIRRCRRSPSPTARAGSLPLEEINAAGGVGGTQARGHLARRRRQARRRRHARQRTGLAARRCDADRGHVLLAISASRSADFAKQKKMFFVAAEPLTDAIIWAKGNRYTFRLRPRPTCRRRCWSEEAAKLPAKRWATVAPNYEYGQSAVAVFKELLKEKRPGHRVRRRAVAGRWARSTPAPTCRRSRRPSRRRSSTSPSAPISPSSCAKATRAACSRAARWSACSPASRNISTRSRRRRRRAGSSPAIPGTQIDDAGARGIPRRLSGAIQRLSAPGLGRRLHDLQGRRRDAQEGRLDRHREADRGAAEGSSRQRRSGRSTFRAIDHQSTLGAFVGKTA